MLGVRLYSDADEAAVVAAMPAIMQEAEMLRSRHVAPTTTARRAIMDAILSFVRTHRRKVYGGYALNAAISAVSPTEAFYSCDPESDPSDIEFYSPDPVADVCKLCRTLHAAGHEYVQGKEAMHHGTFTISVEFVRMCDITYVPSCIYGHLPTITDAAEGVDVISPSFAMIDLLRVVCDPFTSHWRLDRMFSRLCLLQRTFPLQISAPPPFNPVANTRCAAGIARAMMVHRTSCIAIGFAAFCAYFPEHEDAANMRSDVVSAVSSKWQEDTYAMEVNLVTLLGREHVIVHDFAPFMDLFGQRRVFMVKGPDTSDTNEVVAVLYDAGHRAVPTCGLCDTKDGLAIAAFPYVLAMALSCAFHAHTEGMEVVAQRFQHMAAVMCSARAERLHKEGVTVVDRGTVLRDFGGMDHIGDTLSTMRSHMVRVDERMGEAGRRGREQAWFTFDPSKRKSEIDPIRTFSDVSGRRVYPAEANTAACDDVIDGHPRMIRNKRYGCR